MIRIPGIVLLLIALVVFVQATQYTVDNAPTIPNSHSVQFFYLEAPFPYNTPQLVKTAAGSNFANYGIGHAGLGVWDTTEDNKYTIEFVSETYEGSLLPDVGTNSLTWKNAGKIVISSPLDDDLWLNARLIATTSGNAYSQLITYLQDDIGTKYDYYQPVTALYVNASLVNTSSGDISNTDVSSIGSIKVNAINSFSFVDDLIYQLSTYGIDLGAFLSIYATSFNYFTRPDTVPTVVSSSHADVLAWFTALDACYNSNFNAVLQSGAGAQAFLTNIRDCYGSYAYVFASPVAVYNLTLLNYSDSFRTPIQSQYVYNLPDSDSGHALSLSTAEYVIIAFVLASVLVGVGFGLHRLTRMKMRRRISMEGNRFAERAVENIVETQEDHEYFHGKQYGNTFFGRLTYFGRSNKYPRATDGGSAGFESNPLR